MAEAATETFQEGLVGEEPEEQTPEGSPEPRDNSTAVFGMGLFYPEAVIMLPLAVFFDLSGFAELIPVVGQVLGFILYFVAVIFFGSWMAFRSYFRGQTGKINIKKKGDFKKTAQSVKKVTKWVKRLKWIRPLAFVLEFIPFINMLPCWTITVWLELQNT